MHVAGDDTGHDTKAKKINFDDWISPSRAPELKTIPNDRPEAALAGVEINDRCRKQPAGPQAKNSKPAFATRAQRFILTRWIHGLANF